MTLDELRAEAKRPYGTNNLTFDDYAISVEEGDFLYALVRVTKPQLVLESGTGTGISGMFISHALRDNGAGNLFSYEANTTCADLARRRLEGLPAEVIEGDCRAHNEHCRLTPNLVYLDSHPGRRPQDIEFWLTCGYQGLVVVHDANREYDQFTLGTGVLLPGTDGFWIGRGR